VSKVEECDFQIGQFLKMIIDSKDHIIGDLPHDKPYKRQNKNGIKGIDLNIIAYQYFDGVDLLAIPGVSHSTVLTFMSEIGPKGIKKFSNAKKFASWLRLAPNNKISGGRTLSNRIPKGSNRLKIALRNAANLPAGRQVQLAILKILILVNSLKKLRSEKEGKQLLLQLPVKLQ